MKSLGTNLQMANEKEENQEHVKKGGLLCARVRIVTSAASCIAWYEVGRLFCTHATSGVKAAATTVPPPVNQKNFSTNYLKILIK